MVIIYHCWWQKTNIKDKFNKAESHESNSRSKNHKDNSRKVSFHLLSEQEWSQQAPQFIPIQKQNDPVSQGQRG